MSELFQPEFVLWPHDDELWVYVGAGMYQSLDGTYTYPLEQVMTPQAGPVVLRRALDGEVSGE